MGLCHSPFPTPALKGLCHKKALQIVEVNRELFEEKWDEWFRAR
jgi:hypothetical protein